jgi:hypothetical protein
MDQGLCEELESGLAVRAALLRKLAARDADPRLLALLDETEAALQSLSSRGDDLPARDDPAAGFFW